MIGERCSIVNSPEFAKRLKTCREAKGLSHFKLSCALEDELGVSITEGSLINYEVANALHSKFGANAGMSTKNLVALAQFFGVTTDWLLGLSDVPTPGADLRSACEYTGLSSMSAQRIKQFGYGAILSQIIETTVFGAVMTNIQEVLDCRRMQQREDYQEIVDAENTPAVQKLLHELQTYGYTGKPIAYFVDEYAAAATRAFELLLSGLVPDWTPDVSSEITREDKPNFTAQDLF